MRHPSLQSPPSKIGFDIDNFEQGVSNCENLRLRPAENLKISQLHSSCKMPIELTFENFYLVGRRNVIGG